MYWPEQVLLREVGPRDGLQNEKVILPVETKIAWVKQLLRAGLTNLEVTSFVHPRAVPQLGDAEALLEGIGHPGSGVTISALVGNTRGMRRALAMSYTCLGEVVVVVSASEAHNQANLNRSVAQSLQELQEICQLARGRLQVRGTVATAFGCPHQGEIGFEEVARVVHGMWDQGIRSITLADTAATGNPRQVYQLVRQVVKQFPGVVWGLHLHEAGWGLANALLGLLAGVVVLESSVGGLGGCPFLPGAVGNVPTEKLVELLHAMKIATGVDLNQLQSSAVWMRELLKEPSF